VTDIDTGAPAPQMGGQIHKLTEAGELADTLGAAVGAAFCEASAARARPAHQLGLSSLGGCRRRAAYALAGTPVSDHPPPREGRAANLGTWQHEGLLPQLAQVLDGEACVEREVVLRAAGLELTGHIDLDWGPVAIDLKTVGEHRLAWAADGPFPEHRVQVAGYALAKRQMGLPSRWCAWVYMDRASGTVRPHVEEFTTALGLRVVDRVEELARLAAQPDTAPRDERGPGLAYSCDECPWLRRCWGEDATPGEVGVQGQLLGRDAQAVAAALEEYVTARNTISDAKAVQEFARAVFEGSTPGVYGRWRWSTARAGQETDAAAAAQLLRDNGLGVPVRARAGALSVRPA
jgi:PD-(D/E)XK nuclease superfamily protein